MNSKYNQYDIDLKIDIFNEILQSNVKLNYYCNVSSTDVLKFYIHKDMDIDSVICDRDISYSIGTEISNWSPFILESKLIELSFNEPVLENERLTIHFSYKGYIGILNSNPANRLTKEWIELGLYTPWFPLNEKLEKAYFNVRVQMDDEYKIMNSRKQGTYSIIQQSTAYADCTIIASKEFKCIEGDFNDIKTGVYYTVDKYKDLAAQISNYLSVILGKYQQFGKPDSQKFSIVIAPREDGGGYCRPGLIVVTPNDDLSNEIDYFKFIAHELAHIWWCKSKNPDMWEDWLNESFAEFSALLAVREKFGEGVFNNKIDIYAQKAKGLPRVKGLDRRHNNAFQVLYVKGPLLLCELEKNIGRDKFGELLQKVHHDSIDTTEKFLKVLEQLTNNETKVYFENLLLS